MKKILAYLKVLPLLLSIVINTVCASTEKNDDLVKDLNFIKFIEIIKTRLPEIKNNTIRVEKSQNALYGANSVDDITLTGGVTYYNNDNYNATNSVYSSKKYESSLGLQKRFSPTGTNVEAGIKYSQVKDEITNNGHKYYRPVIYMEISQPILKNAFGIVDRFTKNDTLMKVKIEELKKKESDESDINYYKKLYYQWIVQREKLELLQQSINNSKALEEQTRRKFKSGMADNDDLQEAVASFLNYQQQYKTNEIAYSQITKEIEIFVNAETPLKKHLEERLNQNEKTSFIDVPFAETANTEIYKLSKENLVYKKGVAKNKLLPELNILSGYNLKSSGSSFNNSVDSISDRDLYVGLTASVSLGNISAKKELKDVLLDMTQLNHEYLISKNQYQKTLNNLLSAINGYQNILNIKKKKLESLESKYKTQNKKYRGARLNLRYLLETSDQIVSEQIDILDIKNSLISYSIDYEELTN